MKKWFAIVCFILINWSNAISAGPVTHVWNNRSISPIGELALLKNQEFAHISFDPPLEIRQDGSLFLSVALVDSESWINLALNSFVSLASHHNISGLTVMTMNDKRLASVFTRLGLYAYDASSTIEGFPEVFRLKNPLTSWSWGAVIFLRFNAWFEAFRRGIGFCFIDTDVTYNRELFFVRDRNGKFVDISTQGEASAITPNSGHQCGYRWIEKFDNRVGFYINPGLSCHAYNERTLKFLLGFQYHIAASIDKKMGGWGQPAYLMHFCESDFVYNSPNPLENHWHWGGHLKKYNLSVSIFRALAPLEPKFPDKEKITPEERPHVPAYHAKACHGIDRSDALHRVRCKEDWLKQQGQWFLPDDLPRTLDEWLQIDEATEAKLKNLLHHTARR